MAADPLLSKLTFRERIVRHMEARYLAQIAGQNNALITWDVVSRKPLTKEQQMMGYALGIYDTSERVKVEIGHDKRWVNLVLEFHVRINDGDSDDVGILLNAVLGEVQRVAGIDIQLGEPDPNRPNGPSYKLAINTTEKGSELEIGGERPSVVAGVLIVEIEYRTKNNNPFVR